MGVTYHLQHKVIPLDVAVFLALLRFGDTKKDGYTREYANTIGVYLERLYCGVKR